VKSFPRKVFLCRAWDGKRIGAEEAGRGRDKQAGAGKPRSRQARLRQARDSEGLFWLPQARLPTARLLIKSARVLGESVRQRHRESFRSRHAEDIDRIRAAAKDQRGQRKCSCVESQLV